MLNAYGLTNDGVPTNAPKIALACQSGFNVIPNFYPQFNKGQHEAIAETLLAVEDYDHYLGSCFWALALNLSCPNSREKIAENMGNAWACVKAIKKYYPDLCLIAKISIVHPPEFAKQLVDAGVDIIHAVNAVPYNSAYPDGPPSPLAKAGGGGVSGGPAFMQAFNYNKILRPLVSAPMIMSCGIAYLSDAKQYFDIGADAVCICTVCRLNPNEAIKIILSKLD